MLSTVVSWKFMLSTIFSTNHIVSRITNPIGTTADMLDALTLEADVSDADSDDDEKKTPDERADCADTSGLPDDNANDA